MTTVHPHAGGENLGKDLFWMIVGGPSPRGWGKRCPARPCRICARSIPTRVGKTFTRGVVAKFTAVHPHAGGENDRRNERGAVYLGPSPRGWGKRCQWRPVGQTGRSIPTRVGKTSRLCNRNANDAVHPHAGGENGHFVKLVTGNSGPSPRGWGKPIHAVGIAGKRRSIPTRVGKTFQNSF